MWNERFRAANGTFLRALPLTPHPAGRSIRWIGLALALAVTLLLPRIAPGPAIPASGITGSTFASVKTLREAFARVRLDEKDTLLYQHLFSLAGDHHWVDLNRLIKDLPAGSLLDWVKARELVDPAYQPQIEELTAWLDRNEFMPQAAAVQKRLATIDSDLAAGYAPMNGPSFTAHGGFRQPLDFYAGMTGSQRSVMDGVLEQFAARRYGLAYKSAAKLAHEAKQTLPGAWWIAGVSAWHLGNLANADHDFRMIVSWAQGQSEHEWLAQSAYWAYRTANRTGNTAASTRFLGIAAHEEETFYGLLAAAALRKPLAFPPQRADLSSDGIRTPVMGLMTTAALLTHIGHSEDAESLLRHNFAQLEPLEQQALMWTATELKLADVQLPMSARLPNAELASRYPLPEWKTTLSLEPSLVLAIVRRESGFDPSAGSGAGAQGLMQIMPATANEIIKQQNALGVETADSSDKGFLAVAKYRSFGLKNVDVNLAVGQAYLRYLKARPEIDGSLIRLLASYNAGPGQMQSWTPERDENDPLLFIESIPLRETRDYVRNVLTDYWIYGYLLGKQPSSLSSLSENHWPKLDI